VRSGRHSVRVHGLSQRLKKRSALSDSVFASVWTYRIKRFHHASQKKNTFIKKNHPIGSDHCSFNHHSCLRIYHSQCRRKSIKNAITVQTSGGDGCFRPAFQPESKPVENRIACSVRLSDIRNWTRVFHRRSIQLLCYLRDTHPMLRTGKPLLSQCGCRNGARWISPHPMDFLGNCPENRGPLPKTLQQQKRKVLFYRCHSGHYLLFYQYPVSYIHR